MSAHRRHSRLRQICKLSLGGLFCIIGLLEPSRAEDVYQEPSAFLEEVFQGAVPEPSIVRLIGNTREVATELLGHSPAALRVRYWKEGTRSAWILEEIGKTKPITTGFVLEGKEIVDVRVLIYRESHGAEVRHDFFTEQFKGVQLDEQRRLDSHIDGISGATLSVGALKRLAALALFLAEEVNTP